MLPSICELDVGSDCSSELRDITVTFGAESAVKLEYSLLRQIGLCKA